MSGSARVSIEAIKEALRTNGGNVAAAAEQVRLSRKNFYERLEVSGIDPNEFRSRTRGTASTGRDGVPGLSPPVGAPFRLDASIRETLRQAAIDLAYVRRREYTSSQVLEEFVTEAFEAWLAAKKGAAR